MTFLQPYILWGLPLILLPILIHLFNRLRHRSMPWAAMMFLRSATRKSTRYARLRQFLILLFRVLAVLGLIMAVSRPLAGGWMGWMLGGAPEVILVVLDRSASMETKTSPAAEASKRAEGLSMLAQTSAGFRQTSRLVLLESATGSLLEVPPGALEQLSLTQASDTAADLPSLLEEALEWFVEQRPGSGELWIASDLQTSNWQPESERWEAVAAGFEALPQSVRVRLLALNQEPAENLSITLFSAQPRLRGGQWDLDLVFDVVRHQGSVNELPVRLVVNGAASQLDIQLESPVVRYRHRVPLGSTLSEGWGYAGLPADGNLRDNRSYFVFGPVPPLVTAVVAKDPWTRAVLGLAAAPDPGDTNQVSRLLNPEQVSNEDWNQYALVVCQGEMGEASAALERYVRAGGWLLCFPPAGSESFAGLDWEEPAAVEGDDPMLISNWDRQEGPLADSEEGLSLDLEGLAVRRRQLVAGEAVVMATFADGAPFLVRRALDRGQVYFCSVGLHPEWSNLGEGTVLVPMVQRLLQEGARRFQQQHQLEAGFGLEETDGWTVVDSDETKDPQTQAGVYRRQGKLLAVNRPAIEDDAVQVEAERAKALFGGLTTQLFEERGGSSRLQSELWRIFLLAMAGFLLVEAILILPERSSRAGHSVGKGQGGSRRVEQPSFVARQHG